jgi:hypothetical protein
LASAVRVARAASGAFLDRKVFLFFWLTVSIAAIVYVLARGRRYGPQRVNTAVCIAGRQVHRKV